jgi:hypothetical protein
MAFKVAPKSHLRRDVKGHPIRERTMEMGTYRFLISFFLLFALGALLATSYIMMHTPGCLQIPGWSSSSNPETVSEKDTQHQQQQQHRIPPSTTAAAKPEPKEAPALASVAAKVAATPAAAVPTLPSKLPPACTAPQMATLKLQLQERGCLNDKPYLQSCSFTKATKGCHNPFWMRDHYAKTKLTEKFFAVQVGCTKTKNYMMDAWAVGSHTVNHPAMAATGQTSGGVQCKRPAVVGASTTGQPAQVVCLQEDPTIVADLNALSRVFLLTAKSFATVTAKMSNIPGAAVDGVPTSTLDKTLAEKFPDQTQPIHYLNIEEPGMEAEILSGSTQTLDRVRYLEFGYHYLGNWANQNLKSLVESQLAQKYGFVCYWHGSDSNLWRITDCWQAHYEYHSWSYIACVSSKHADAKPILDKMEEQFAATLKKDLIFG